MAREPEQPPQYTRYRAPRRLLPRLVRMPIGSGAPVRRVVPRAELGDDEWRVAQLLAATRLLVINTRICISREDRLGFDAESVEQGLAKLVLTLIELIRRLLEKQAVRRMEGGGLTDEQIEQLGLALMKLEGKMGELKAQFGLEDEDLNIDLGPIGRLS